MTAFAALLAQVSDHLGRVAGSDYPECVTRATALLRDALASGNKILVFGNGGSAADAQHIAAELVGRFAHPRRPLAALALGTNAAYLTAWSNDVGYDEVFARELEAVGRPGDVAWGISTSGNSISVITALARARSMGMKTIALTGASAGKLVPLCDVVMAAPLTATPRIQEVHLITYHAICEALETGAIERQA